jgi:uncharacterized damage-inducible protein DinB
MNHSDLQTMLDFHYWARDRLLEALEALTPDQYNKDLGSSFKSIRDTATHTYAAEWAWHERWQGRSPTALMPSDRFADVAALKSAWQGIDRTIQYKLLSGADGSSPIWQMVQHVVNHASYHRGQITTMLRQLGAQPAKSMDMIAFYRTR